MRERAPQKLTRQMGRMSVADPAIAAEGSSQALRGGAERCGGQVVQMQGSAEERRERIRRMRERAPEKVTRQMGRMSVADPAIAAEGSS